MSVPNDSFVKAADTVLHIRKKKVNLAFYKMNKYSSWNLEVKLNSDQRWAQVNKCSSIYLSI